MKMYNVRKSAFGRILLLLLFSFTAVPINVYALGGVLKVSFRDAGGAYLGSYLHLKYPSWGSRTHFGNDVIASCGSVIYAPGSGVVVDVVRPGTVNYDSLGNAVIILHRGEGRGGADLYSLMLHMQESALVNVGDEVTQDTIVGHVGMTGAANGICHTHFELRYFRARFFPAYGNIYGPGDVSGTSTARDNWENPDAYLLGLVPYSYFDGSGSLVDPARGGACTAIGSFGCSRDIVRLHPHAVPSTGIFQVLSQPGYCDYVRVEGLQSAYIGVKRWNETYPVNTDGLSTIYRSYGAQVNVRIPTSEWVQVSVTTTIPIPSGSTRSVSVSCQVGAFYQVAGTQLIDIAPALSDRPLNPYPMLIRLPADFFWSGSGSLITRSGNTSTSATASGYGRTRDDAIKLSSKKSLLSFQVYSDGISCRSVRVMDAAGTTGAVIETSVKGWADPDWGQASSGAMPRDVALPGAGFWIVKVKPAELGFLRIRMSCN